MPPPLEIVWCVETPGFGGAERDLLRVIDMLRGCWPRQTVAHALPLAPQLETALRAAAIATEPFEGGSRLRALPRAWRAAGKLLSKHPSAAWVVWCHHFDACRWLQQRLAASRRPFVISERTMAWSPEAFSRSRLTRPLKRRAVARARAVVLPGAVQAEYYPALFGVSDRVVRFVPNSRPVRALAARAAEARCARELLRRERGLPPEAFIVLNVGRLDGNKGQDVLIRAAAEARKALPHLYVCLVGSGPAESDLARLCREALPGAHQLAGERSDVTAYMGVADVFAFPSRAEGLSGALIEAMACGVPVIASDIPGNRELVSNEQTGLLASLGSVQDLSNAILRVASDATSSRRWAARALELVERSYDERVEREGWHAVFDAVNADDGDADPFAASGRSRE